MTHSAHSHALARLLISKGLLDTARLDHAIQQADFHRVPLISQLIIDQHIQAHTLAQLLSQATTLGVVDLDRFEVLPVELLDARLIHEHRLLPLGMDGEVLQIAISNPLDKEAMAAARFASQKPLRWVIVEEDKLAARLGALTLPTDITLIDDAPEEIEQDTPLDAPTVKFVDKILHDAIKLGASDIHFEVFEKLLRIRYRIDGLLQPVMTLPVANAAKIIARLKVMAQLDISERRKPQDGRIKFTLPNAKAIDFRVSTLPTLFGEKVVLRLLDATVALIGLDALGLSEHQRQIFKNALQKPQGMILITGPTGSGKTVSLYTALELLNETHTNIITAEDPVEIYLDGINQVNINPKVQLDFADALRAFLRQDPDVIMVGEIRDIQTAEIAIKAAQTGHLVLSTLHTNSSAQTITRLQSMGVPSFQLASAISLIIAQRLARKLCNDCKTPIEIPKASLIEAGFSQVQIEQRPTIYTAVGCSRCRDGYKGRVGIFELLTMTPQIAQLIMTHQDTQSIADAAKQSGQTDLRQAAIAQVIAGTISLDELYRIS